MNNNEADFDRGLADGEVALVPKDNESSEYYLGHMHGVCQRFYKEMAALVNEFDPAKRQLIMTAHLMQLEIYR